MKKLLLLFLLLPSLYGLAQTTDANLKAVQIDPKIRNITTAAGITKGNVSDVLQAIVDSKISRIEACATSGTNTYTVTVPWATGYVTNMQITLFVGNANSGASTLNVNSYGAKTVLLQSGAGLTGGELKGFVQVSYNGTTFQIMGGSGGNTVSTGNLTTSTTGIFIVGGTGAVVGSGTTVNIQNATASQTGLLTNTDWNTFNGKQAAGSYAVTTNNLSDLTNAVTARTNLGLGSLATLNSINNSNWSGTALAHSNIAATTVTPGSCTNCNLTVQADGTITEVSNGSGGGGSSALTPTAVKTASYSASVGDFIPYDVTSGSYVVTLPNAPADKSRIGVKIVNPLPPTFFTNTVTINASGSDKINIAGTTSTTLVRGGQTKNFQYVASTGIWYITETDEASAGTNYTFSTTSPSTDRIWVDTGNGWPGGGVNYAYPIRTYVNGAWTAVSDNLDWWFVTGSCVSKGKPIAMIVTGQSNAWASIYFPNSNPTYTGDITVNNLLAYWNRTASRLDILRSTTLGDPANATVGTFTAEIAAKLFIKKYNRAVVMVGTREPGQAMSYWESAGTGWTNLTATLTASGISYFDLMVWQQGEAGLGTSSFSNYQDSFVDFYGRLRGLTNANPKMLVIGMTHALAIGLNIAPTSDADYAQRKLASDNDVYTNYAKLADSKLAQYLNSDQYHFTTLENEWNGAAVFRAWQELPQFEKKNPTAFSIDAYTGNLVTTKTLSYDAVDNLQINHQSTTPNSTGSFIYAFGAGGAQIFTSRMRVTGTGSTASTNIAFDITAAGTAVGPSDQTLLLSAIGTQFTKPISITASNSLMMHSILNNSGDMMMTYAADGATNPTNSTLGKTGFVFRPTGSNSWSNFHLIMQGTGATANIATETSFWIGQSGGTINDLRMGLQSLHGTTLNSTNVLGTFHIFQAANTTNFAVPVIRLDPGAHTGLNANSEVNIFTESAVTQTYLDGTTPTWRGNWFKAVTLNGTTTLATFGNPFGLFQEVPIAGAKSAFTNGPYGIGTNGSIVMTVAGNKFYIKEGSNGSLGQTTLVSGTKAITVTGTTTSTRCFLNIVTQGGTVTTTVGYGCVCTANTVTITALTSSGTTNTTDTSIINYHLIEPTP